MPSASAAGTASSRRRGVSQRLSEPRSDRPPFDQLSDSSELDSNGHHYSNGNGQQSSGQKNGHHHSSGNGNGDNGSGLTIDTASSARSGRKTAAASSSSSSSVRKSRSRSGDV